MDNDVKILDVLNQSHKYYFSNSRLGLGSSQDITERDIVLYRIDEITFEEEAPRKEALENVLSSVRIPGVNFLYLIVGDAKGVKFYYGLSKNPSEAINDDLLLSDIGRNVLMASIKGNFRGCKVQEVNPEEAEPVLNKVRHMKYASRIEGVAGTIKDNEEFQSVDRLVDVMQGEEFCLLLVAKALQPDSICELEQTLQEAYTTVSPLAKYSLQEGSSEGKSKSQSWTKGENSSSSVSHSKSTGENKGWSKGVSTNNSVSTTTSSSSGGSSSSTSSSKQSSTGGGESKGESGGTNSSSSDSTSSTKGDSHSVSDQEGTNSSTSKTYSREYLNKKAGEWIKYCDEVIFPRLDYGKGKGIFLSAIYVLTKNKPALIKLENTALALYSGKQGNKVPLRSNKLDASDRAAVKNYQLPRGHFAKAISEEEKLARAMLSQPVDCSRDFALCNWITTNELSMLAGLPQKEVIGMRLREEVEFGLNYTEPEQEDCIYLGNLVQNGNEVERTPIYLDKDVLDKHIFIAGVTGSGKTTTCHKILLQSKLPFLVIEPAKTEYRILRNNPACKDLLVFTLGNEKAAPFRLNPFEFLPHENITSHVDMIKASIEAAFDMEAAIPQLIETILYKCYEDYGWDITTNKNSKYADPFADGVFAFPTMGDLLNNIEKVVKEQGFDERLKNDYIGSIRARLQSLVIGSKGLMLNTRRSINFADLLDRKVVLELEGIKNGNEKALIMGFVLAAFNEAVKARYLHDKKAHAHIILVEESHRLLSKYMPGDSQNKKQGVETFSDMLAEIRKYGEGLIIVDQIPNKLAPDVLKNTNTKIVHRLFAQDDKEAVGNTMALKEEQKEFLSNLNAGRAIMFSDNYGQALQVQIKADTSTENAPLADEELTCAAFDYYQRCVFKNVKINAQNLTSEQKVKAVELLCNDNGIPANIMRRVNEHKEAWNEYCAETIEFLSNNIPANIVRRVNEHKDAWNEYYATMLRSVVEDKIISLADIVAWGLAAVDHAQKDDNNIKQAFAEYFTAYMQGEKAEDNFVKNNVSFI